MEDNTTPQETNKPVTDYFVVSATRFGWPLDKIDEFRRYFEAIPDVERVEDTDKPGVLHVKYATTEEGQRQLVAAITGAMRQA